jgi:hypothetical protein
MRAANADRQRDIYLAGLPPCAGDAKEQRMLSVFSIQKQISLDFPTLQPSHVTDPD